MIQLGRFNHLAVKRLQKIGALLDGGERGEILLPRRQLPDDCVSGDHIEVFVYRDSEDRIIATRRQPKVQVGQCAYLKVVSRNAVGAFLDWGLPKDLLVPFGEQQTRMKQGYSYAVYAYIDETSDRIVASSRLERHLSRDVSTMTKGQSVDLLIYGKSDLGFKAIVDNRHLGQLYDNETFRRLHYGETLPGYIKQIRKDGKIDLSLQPSPEQHRNDLKQAILKHLRQNSGISTLTDNSSPDEIYQAYGVSKASYKKALGQLYRQRDIKIEKHRITLA